MEISADQDLPSNRQDALEDLVEKIDDFSISDPTQTHNQLKQLESYSDTVTLSKSTSKTSVHPRPSPSSISTRT
jgi:hypothetical protein